MTNGFKSQEERELRARVEQVRGRLEGLAADLRGRTLKWILACLFLLAMSPAALASEVSAGHESSVPAVILWLAIILVAAKLGGHFAVKAGQPPVLGELLVGVLQGT